jgi:hypothetical protein
VLAAFSLALLLSSAAQPPAGAAAPVEEVLAQVQVHGNTLTATADVLMLAGVTVGMPIGSTTIADIERRLREAGQFEHVEVRKRLASITDPSQVLLIIVVDDGPVRIEFDADSGAPARAVRRRGLPFMVLPLLRAEDGYGLTYGARIALPDLGGTGSRISFPLTWGGERRAAIEFEKEFASGPLTRLTAGASLDRRENPFFEQPDTRRRLWARAERAIVSGFRVGAAAGWNRVTFPLTTTPDRFTSVGVDAVVDTRLDPVLARNAGYARLAWQRLSFDGAPAVPVTETDLRGYLGLIGQSVLVVRVQHNSARAPLPPYQQYLMGGLDNLRGFRAGSAAGDTLAAGSLELRVPLTSPLSFAKLGVSAFADAAAVYNHGQRLRGQPFKRGVGGSVWVTAAVLRLNLAVARGLGRGTRVHFGTSVAF